MLTDPRKSWVTTVGHMIRDYGRTEAQSLKRIRVAKSIQHEKNINIWRGLNPIKIRILKCFVNSTRYILRLKKRGGGNEHQLESRIVEV